MAKAHSWLSDTSDEDDDGSLFSSRTAGGSESMGPANATQPASAARRKFTINLNDSDSEDDLARAHLDFLKKLEQERQAKMGADESEGEEDVKEKEKERKRRGSAADADVLSDEEDEGEDDMLDEDEEDEEEERRRRKTRPKKMMVRVGVKKKPAAEGGEGGRGQAKATKKRQLKRAEVDEEDEDASMLPSSGKGRSTSAVLTRMLWADTIVHCFRCPTLLRQQMRSRSRRRRRTFTPSSSTACTRGRTSRWCCRRRCWTRPPAPSCTWSIDQSFGWHRDPPGPGT